MAVSYITRENFKEEVLNAKKPVLIDFWASWCGPCRMLSPIVEELSEEVDGTKICKINVDEEPELANAFQVMSIPMLVLVKDGKIVSQSVGLSPKKKILELMKTS